MSMDFSSRSSLLILEMKNGKVTLCYCQGHRAVTILSMGTLPAKALLAWLRLFSPYLALVIKVWAKRKKKKSQNQMSKRLLVIYCSCISEVLQISYSS